MKFIKLIIVFLIIVLIIGIILLTGTIVSINEKNKSQYDANYVFDDIGDENKG